MKIRWILLLVIGLSGALPMRAANWLKKLPHEHPSRYFHFYYQRAEWPAAAFAQFADAFVDLVNRDFMEMKFEYPIDVLVLPDRPSFQKFLRDEFREKNPPAFGIYFPAFKVFVTYEESGIGTFAHEIMHPHVDRNLPDCPRWAEEGIPSFFEKFYGYWDGERLVVQWGYQNPWRLLKLGDDLTTLDLPKLLTDRRAETRFANSDRRLVTVFLWQQGRFERFIRLIASRKHPGYGSYFEAAMEMPLSAIVPLWQAYLNDIAAHRDEAMHLPSSAVLANREAFESAMAKYHLWLQPRVDTK